MLSTDPVGPTTVLAPPPGGTLLCVWLSSAAETLRVCRTLRQLVQLPSCGAQSWDTNDRVLFVVWAEAGQETTLRGLLRAFGEVLDWTSRLRLSGAWTVFDGTPLYAAAEYELERAV